MDVEKFREKVWERREKDWIRDSLLLRDKSPEETLAVMFDMCRFAKKLREAVKVSK